MDFVHLNYSNQVEENNDFHIEQSFNTSPVVIEIPGLVAILAVNISIEIPINNILNNYLNEPSNNIIAEQIDLSLNNLTNILMLIPDPEYIDEITCIVEGRKKRLYTRNI